MEERKIKRNERTFEEYMRISAERFWKRVYIPLEDNERQCCAFTGSHTKDNFGQFRLSYRGKTWTVSAHRFAWEATHGPVPAGFGVYHTCGHAWCVNPQHLYIRELSVNTI